MRIRSYAVGFVAVVLMFGIAVCGCGGHGSANAAGVGTAARAARSTTTSQAVRMLPGGASIATVAELNPSYDVPESTNMAGDPTGSGVFFWSASRKDLEITRVDDRGVTRWHTATGRGGGASVGQSIAIDTRGIVWIVAGTRLIRLDPRSGTIATVAIPAPAAGSVGQVVGPPEIRNFHSLQAIAVDEFGDVAIAMENTSQVLVHHESSGLFSHIDLPTDFAAWSVAYFGDGTLAIGGLISYHVSMVFLYPPNGTAPRSIAVPDAARLMTISNTAMLAGGFSPPEILTPDGKVSPVALPSKQDSVTAALPDGHSLSEEKNDLIDVRPDGSVANTYRFPLVACDALDLGGMMHQTKQGSSCAVAPSAVQTDGAGDVWLVQNPISTGRPAASRSESVAILKGF